MTRTSSVCGLRSAVLGIVILSASVPAFARNVQDIKTDDAARVLRRHRDPKPEAFKPVGEDVDRILVNLVITPKVDADLRVKAAVALGGFPGNKARGALVTTLANPQEPSTLRAAAMLGLARAFQTAVVEDLRPYLKDADPVLRAGAGRALGATGSDRARTLLMDAIDHEESLEVRQAMEDGLKLL